MQPGPAAAQPRARTTSFRFIVVGAVLILVGSVMSYASGLVIAVSYPYSSAADTGLMLAAAIVSIIGAVLASIGFFLAFYGIALRLRFLATRVRPGTEPDKQPGSTLIPPTSPESAAGRSLYTITVIGGAFVLLGRLVAVSVSIFPLIMPVANWPGFSYLQTYYSLSFAGNFVAAVGFLAAFYGIGASIHRAL